MINKFFTRALAVALVLLTASVPLAAQQLRPATSPYGSATSSGGAKPDGAMQPAAAPSTPQTHWSTTAAFSPAVASHEGATPERNPALPHQGASVAPQGRPARPATISSTEVHSGWPMSTLHDTDHSFHGHTGGPGAACEPCSMVYRPFVPQEGFFAGAELLMVRPHFSQAMAFARGTQTATTFQTEAETLDFSYDASLRAVAGYRFGGGQGEVRFTYWNFRGDTSVAGVAPGPGEFIVDPFGNVVGSVVHPIHGPLPGGDLIQTNARVRMNVYDVDFVSPILMERPQWVLEWSAGFRVADIDQSYVSVITAGGAPFSHGDFSAEFLGAGPRVGLGCRRFFGDTGRFSLFVQGHGALLVGQYEVRSANQTTMPVLRAVQRERTRRTIPVMDIETGLSWRLTDSATITAGRLFQTWFDLGTSGGQFNGLYQQADDANLMSFDGMFLRAELTF